MDNYLEERTINGKTWDIHEVLPYVGDYCADWGRSINVIKEWGPEAIFTNDWFPSPDEWGIVFDWLCDFAEVPEELDMPHERLLEFFEGLAKDYVGYDDSPDPDFWKKIARKYPMCKVEA